MCEQVFFEEMENGSIKLCMLMNTGGPAILELLKSYNIVGLTNPLNGKLMA